MTDTTAAVKEIEKVIPAFKLTGQGMLKAELIEARTRHKNALKLSAELQKDMRKTITTAFNLGNELKALKVLIPHGMWLPLLASIKVEVRQAQRYMKLADMTLEACLQYGTISAALEKPKATTEQAAEEGEIPRSDTPPVGEEKAPIVGNASMVSVYCSDLQRVVEIIIKNVPEVIQNSFTAIQKDSLQRLKNAAER